MPPTSRPRPSGPPIVGIVVAVIAIAVLIVAYLYATSKKHEAPAPAQAPAPPPAAPAAPAPKAPAAPPAVSSATQPAPEPSAPAAGPLVISLDPAMWLCPQPWETEVKLEEGGKVLRLWTQQSGWHFMLRQSFAIAGAAKLRLSGEWKIQDVVKGKDPIDCARVQLMWMDDNGDQVGDWPRSELAHGTRDWSPFVQEVPVPPQATHVMLWIGMYLSTGTAWYRNLQLAAWDKNGKPLAVRSVSGDARTDTKGWWEWKPIADDPSKPLGLDLSKTLDAPAGKRGWLQIKGEQYVFADGTPIRFWGSGHSDWFVPHSTARRYAERMARLGMNMTRLHSVDDREPKNAIFSEQHDTSQLDPRRLDLLDKFVAECKQRGIYIFFDALAKRRFRAKDGVVDWDKVDEGGKPASMWNRRMIELQKQYLTDLLGHVNPYTGVRWADDPMIALIETINECTLLDPGAYRNATPYYLDEIDRLFSEWCQRQGIARPQGRFHELVREKNQHALKFAFETENAYHQEIVNHLRGLGIKCPITNTNWRNHAPNIAYGARMGFVDRHYYHDLPQGWEPTSGFQNHPLINGMGIVHEMIVSRVLGVPYGLSEWACVWSNEWITEGPVVMGAVAGYQNYGHMLIFGIIGKNPQEKMENCWIYDDKPHVVAQYAAMGLAFRRGDIAPPPEAVAIALHEALDAEVSLKDIPLPVAITRRAGYTLDRARATPLPAVADGPELSTPDGQLRWAKGRYLAVASPRTCAITGRLGSERVGAGALSVETRTGFVAITAVSLEDDKPLPEARRILLAASARAENSDSTYRPFRKGLATLGRAPILVEPVHAQVTLKRQRPGTPTVYALDQHGRRTGATLPVKAAPGSITIELGSAPGLWFEITE